MATELISLQEAADGLGVHYMTAYRYVRLGRLPAVKEGGQWWVRRQDVDALRSQASAPRDAGRRGNPQWARYRERLLDRLLAGDEAGGWAIVESALVAGGDPRGALLELVAPVMRLIGDRWEEGSLSVGDEHRATAVATRIVARLGPSFARRGRRKGTVIVGGASGDLHSLPAAILSDVLRGEQYAVIDLGANTPAESFVEAAKGVDDLVAVGISVATSGRERIVSAAAQSIRDAVPGVPVLLGGPAVPDQQTAGRLGADGWAPDAGATAVLLASLGRD